MLTGSSELSGIWRSCFSFRSFHFGETFGNKLLQVVGRHSCLLTFRGCHVSPRDVLGDRRCATSASALYARLLRAELVHFLSSLTSGDLSLSFSLPVAPSPFFSSPSLSLSLSRPPLYLSLSLCVCVWNQQQVTSYLI